MSSPLFRELFGTSREEIWRQLAAETGAAYIDGGFWKGDKIQASHGQWQITLEVVSFAIGRAADLEIDDTAGLETCATLTGAFNRTPL